MLCTGRRFDTQTNNLNTSFAHLLNGIQEVYGVIGRDVKDRLNAIAERCPVCFPFLFTPHSFPSLNYRTHLNLARSIIWAGTSNDPAQLDVCANFKNYHAQHINPRQSTSDFGKSTSLWTLISNFFCQGRLDDCISNCISSSVLQLVHLQSQYVVLSGCQDFFSRSSKVKCKHGAYIKCVLR